MSRRSSLKDTLFLSRAESECVVEGRGGLWFGSVGRTGELGHKKIPGLWRTVCSSSVKCTHIHIHTRTHTHTYNRWMGKTDTRMTRKERARRNTETKEQDNEKRMVSKAVWHHYVTKVLYTHCPIRVICLICVIKANFLALLYFYYCIPAFLKVRRIVNP